MAQQWLSGRAGRPMTMAVQIPLHPSLLLLFNVILSLSFYGTTPFSYETTATAASTLVSVVSVNNSRYLQACSRFIFIILLHLWLLGQLAERTPIS